MMNSNVDQNGIPYKGFIMADKIRARKNRAQQGRKPYEAASVLTEGLTAGVTEELTAGIAEGESREMPTLIEMLSSSKASMVGAMTLLLLSATVAYLAGEKQGLSHAGGNSGASISKPVVTPAVPAVNEVAVLRNEIEREKSNISRKIVQQETSEQALMQGELMRQEAMQREAGQLEAGQLEAGQQTMAQITRQSLSRLKQSLDPQNGNIQLNINTGMTDDYSSSLSDPLSGDAVNQSDSELQKLRLRVIGMIDAQAETSLFDR